MATESQRETLTLGKRRLVQVDNREEEAAAGVEDEEEEEEREIQELEREVSLMGRSILDARRTIPDRLLEALSSRLLAQRPVLPSQALLDPDAGSTGMRAPPSESNGGNLLASADRMMLEKLLVFKAKTESNIALMPVILKRINDCILKIEQLEKCDVNIHSVFIRK